MASDNPNSSPSRKHPFPTPKPTYAYGTAGFRMKADILDPVLYRVGFLAALRSRELDGKYIGVMITASHNPPADNGVKLVDPMGEMLHADWEVLAKEIANAAGESAADASDEDRNDADQKALLDWYKGHNTKPGNRARVIFARDTRKSGPKLVESLVHGLEAAGLEKGDYQDFGELTTPQLHYLVRCANEQDKTDGDKYGEFSDGEQGYYKKLAAAFKSALGDKKPNGPVTVDCANGVGGPQLQKLIAHLKDTIDIKVINDDVKAFQKLNVKCGSDYVKDNQVAPPSSEAGALERCASLDGDGDRIVYYFTRENGSFGLLDGDRIATLAASFLGDLGQKSGLAESLKIGIVQTAYANGGSTEYVTSTLKLPVACTKTGVKHLHHEALKFDIGVYFEANGHGTVVFSEKALKAIADHKPSGDQEAAHKTLKALTDLINQTVGDALSDLLLVEVILAHKNWGPTEWYNVYRDLPNKLEKVQATRTLFETTDQERKLTKPVGLQKKIDELVGNYKSGRAFARPSGTEDVVRVYAEADDKKKADELAEKVKELISEADQASKVHEKPANTVQ